MNKTPTLIIHCDDEEALLKALPGALYDFNWRKADDTGDGPLLLTAHESGTTPVTVRIERLEARKLLVSQTDPATLSSDTRLAALCDFSTCLVAAFFDHKTFVVGVSLKDGVNMHHLMDARASRYLESFVATAQTRTGTAPHVARDAFQHFVVQLHRSQHQVTHAHVFFWALDRGFEPTIAARMTNEFRFASECLKGYDIWSLPLPKVA